MLAMSFRRSAWAPKAQDRSRVAAISCLTLNMVIRTQKGQSGLMKKRSSHPGWLASANEPVPE